MSDLLDRGALLELVRQAVRLELDAREGRCVGGGASEFRTVEAEASSTGQSPAQVRRAARAGHYEVRHVGRRLLVKARATEKVDADTEARGQSWAAKQLQRIGGSR